MVYVYKNLDKLGLELRINKLSKTWMNRNVWYAEEIACLKEQLKDLKMVGGQK